jgi:hypothetical protein
MSQRQEQNIKIRKQTTMRQRFEFRVIVGMLIWIGLISGVALLVRHRFTQSPSAVRQLAQFVGNQRFSTCINFATPQVLKVGDPVFLAGSQNYTPIGFVSRAGGPASTSKAPTYTDTATITFFGNAPQVDSSDVLNFHVAGQDTAWVLETMLPPAKRDEIGKLILKAYAQNQSEIVEAIRPIVEQSLSAAGTIVKVDLKNAFEKRESRIREIGKKYQSVLIEEELIPLIRQEIWPIVQTESQPLATRIGQEIWQEVSVFGLGWRYLYDRSPLPEKNLSEQELKRFVEQKAIPILQSHLKEFLALQQTIVSRLAENEKVRDTVSDSVKTVVNDPEVKQIFQEVFQEVFIDNARLKEAVREHWNSPAARAAIELTSQRLEPTITDIGISLFGSPRDQITPEFARVLRHRILHKDNRWFTLQINGPTKNSQTRAPKPEFIEVRIAEPSGQIPYAPARTRN